ncbi:MAG: sensor histidine kinase [Anaerolineae bacterium]|jgi:signal transduction histidine kinase|nr:sensor histidine kinase [Anaerolineae bacterium]
MQQKFNEIFQYRYSDTVEPGLFQLFQTYMVFFDVITALTILNSVVEERLFRHPAYIPGLVALVLVNILLFTKKDPIKRGPILLALCIGLYILITASFLWGELIAWQPKTIVEWAGFYFRIGFTTLFIPFLIAAWQFGFRGTLVFVGLASLLETGVFSLALPEDMLLFSIGFILFRSINYFVIGLIISRLMLAQRRQRYELKMANQQLTHYASTLEQLATSRERNRLARELHDTLAHTLSGVSVQLEAVRALWDPKPGEAKAMLEQALRDTRNGLTDTRRALKDLRAEPLEDLGLSLAIEQLCHAFNERTSIETSLELPEELTLSAAAQNCIYRTVQEGLMNIDRHAGASRVEVSVRSTEEGDYILTIHDDGIGFDPSGHVEEAHFGLRGIRERTALIGGTCQINSESGNGTMIIVTLNGELAA